MIPDHPRKKTLNYTTLYGANRLHLEERVRKFLRAGWTLQGGVAIGLRGFYQAMVREEPSE